MFLSLFPRRITVLPFCLAAVLNPWKPLVWKDILLLYKLLVVTKHHWEISNIFPHRWIQNASYICKKFHSYGNTVSTLSTIKNFIFWSLSATSSLAFRFPVVIKPGHPYFTVSLYKLFQSWSAIIIHAEFKLGFSYNKQNCLTESKTQRVKKIQGHTNVKEISFH